MEDEMKYHRLSKYFPLLKGEEFDLLKQDIKENGQLEEIVLCDDEILDGVNRWRAIEELQKEGIDIEPATKALDNGISPLNYVISMNLRRRHLNESQIGIISVEMRPEIESEVEEKGGEAVAKELGVSLETEQDKAHPTDAITGKKFGISRATHARAKRVKEQAPEKVDEIIEGTTSVRAVDAELRQKKAQELANKRKEKTDDKTVKEHPKIVKEYLNAAKEYKQALKLAIAGAQRDRFSPEAGQFIERWHNDIRNLMSDLERELP
jgi:hypothetical protein